MSGADLPQRRWPVVVFFLTALLVVVADQLTKLWIRTFSEGQLVFKLGFFQIVHIRNTGAAFGLFQGQSLALTIVDFVSIAIILVLVLRFSSRFPILGNMVTRIALALVLGGTVGNLIDRLNPNLEGVTDFISVGIWPSFNLADSAITVGVILLAYSLIFLTRAEKG
jgi:signal peptidase II